MRVLPEARERTAAIVVKGKTIAIKLDQINGFDGSSDCLPHPLTTNSLFCADVL